MSLLMIPFKDHIHHCHNSLRPRNYSDQQLPITDDTQQNNNIPGNDESAVWRLMTIDYINVGHVNSVVITHVHVYGKVSGMFLLSFKHL